MKNWGLETLCRRLALHSLDLDLASVRHLVEAMRSCRGAFIVVSHDPRFLDELDLTRRIEV